MEKHTNSSVDPIGVEHAEAGRWMNKDEAHLARLGYKQEFFRHLGFFENWAATFSSMNVVSGIPMLFGWAMYTGGPTAAFSNWTMVGGCAFITSLALAEIAAALPTAGGIYFWSYRLGGEKWGPFLSWMTAWWNWVGWLFVVPGAQQGATNFLLGAIDVSYPGTEIVKKGWFGWILTVIGLVIATIPNVISPRVLKMFFRLAIGVFFTLLLLYWIWFPVKAAQNGHFQSSSQVFNNFYNGINLGVDADGNTIEQSSDSYCWVVGVLFGSWVFYGYDSSAHLAEETNDASITVAKGMWISTFSSWLISVPTLILILFCLQDLDGIVNATYANNFAEYLVQLLGRRGAVAVLSILWLDSTCAIACCILSAQRVTFAISRDGVLPFSFFFRRLNRNAIPANAAMLVCGLSAVITCAGIGSTVALTAMTATATIAVNISYLFPIVARHTVGRKRFQPATWNLGRWALPIGIVASMYILFVFSVLLLPQLYPVTSTTLNYAPVCIGIVTLISLVGWLLPFGLGGRFWFTGPKRTIEEVDAQQAELKE